MKILIAVDASQSAEEVIQAVEARVWPETTQFRIINVVEPVPYYGSELPTAAATDRMIQAEREAFESRRKHVDSLVQSLKDALHSPAVSGDVISGEIRQSIIDESCNWQADLIFLGTHGRRGVSKLFLGSVSEDVAKRAACSVDIVKSPTTKNN